MWTILKVFIEFVTKLLLFYVLVFGHKAGEILVPGPGIKPVSPAWEGKVWATGPERNPLYIPFNSKILIIISLI